MPILPFYLTEFFNSDKTTIGLILACYTIAALTIRPFSGFFVDTIARKPLYILAYFIFTLLMAGYIIAGTLTIFTLFRVFHGLSFGAVSVAENTIVIDITPSARRGEALGYYGLAKNIAISLGPMIGLFLHDVYNSFTLIFIVALLSCVFGFIMAISVRAPYKQVKTKTPISLDRFILLKGIPVALAFMVISIPYGITSTYIAMYGKSIGIQSSIGLFFTLLATGTAVSRLFSGKIVDRGKITQIIIFGLILVCICSFAISLCAHFMEFNKVWGEGVYFASALFLGIGFGSMFPAVNTMFVNLAPNNQRGTATSTYLTSWDVGIGIGLAVGGYIAEISNFQTMYFVGACLIIISTIYFIFVITPYYNKNKIR
jgi:MFS family permease